MTFEDEVYALRKEYTMGRIGYYDYCDAYGALDRKYNYFGSPKASHRQSIKKPFPTYKNRYINIGGK